MICPECGTELGRWALHCPQCKARLPASSGPYLLAATLALLAVALLAILLKTGVLARFFPPASPEPPASGSVPTPPAQAPLAQAQAPPAAGPGFEVSVPFTSWKTQSPGEVDWAGAGAEPALALVRREGLAYGAVFVESSELSAEGLSLLALDRLKARAEGFQLARREAGKLAGEEAQLAEFSLQTGGVEIRYLAAYAARRGRGYQALFWCLEPDYAAFQGEFQKILASWRWQEESP